MARLPTVGVVKAIVSGPSHFLYKNGVLQGTLADAFNLSATKAGILGSTGG